MAIIHNGIFELFDDLSNQDSLLISSSGPSSSDFDVEYKLVISLWVKRGNINVEQVIMSKDSHIDRGPWCLYFTVDNKVGFALYKDNLNTLVVSTTSLIDDINNWYHIVVSWNGGSNPNHISFYINGVYEEGVENGSIGSFVAPLVKTTSRVMIGCRMSNSIPDFFDGRIDSVRLYQEIELSSEDVFILYTEGIKNKIFNINLFADDEKVITGKYYDSNAQIVVNDTDWGPVQEHYIRNNSSFTCNIYSVFVLPDNQEGSWYVQTSIDKSLWFPHCKFNDVKNNKCLIANLNFRRIDRLGCGEKCDGFQDPGVNYAKKNTGPGAVQLIYTRAIKSGSIEGISCKLRPVFSRSSDV